MNLLSLLAVFVGGGLGSVFRFAISRGVLMFQHSGRFPLATLVANVVACIVVVAILYLGRFRSVSTSANLFWIVGFCGGLSTFSTFSYENWLLYRNGSYVVLGANVILSLGLCFLVFILASKYINAPG